MIKIFVKLKKLNVLSVAKIQALFMAIAGLLFGLFMLIVSAIAGSMIGAAFLMISINFLGVIWLIIFGGVFGFIGGLLGAFIYNLLAKWIGGIEMEFEE